MHSAYAPQCSKDVWGLPHLPTKFPCSAIDAFHFRSRIALRSKIWCPKSELKAEFLLRTFWCIWQRREDLQPSGEVSNGFHVGRARDSPLPCTLPVLDGLLAEARLGVVIR
jgi:hypothetical protein